MRCPKCHYISFEAAERCRNCGYDFSLAASSPVAAELPVPNDPIGPLTDLPLAEQTVAGQPRVDLPLFHGGGAVSDVGPLVRGPLTARPPLSVRRRTPEVIKARPSGLRRRDEPTLGLEPAAPGPTALALEFDPSWQTAGLGRRFAAGVIDTAILSLVNAAVIYFTLRLTGLTSVNVFELPPAPLVIFLVLLDGGYFLGFTVAGGQTIGKMATRIKVVGAAGPQVSPRTALLRTAASALSLLPVGLGFLAAVADKSHRTFHDRLAATRVVKVS